MENQIIINLSPVEYKHTIYIMEANANDTPIICSCSLDELPSTIIDLSKQYNVKKINLTGAKDYTRKIKDFILNKNIQYFENNQIIIELV